MAGRRDAKDQARLMRRATSHTVLGRQKTIQTLSAPVPPVSAATNFPPVVLPTRQRSVIRVPPQRASAAVDLVLVEKLLELLGIVRPGKPEHEQDTRLLGIELH